MSEAVEGLTRVGADRHAGRVASAKAAYRHLVWIYLLGSFAAVGVTLLLALLGLEFTAAQWAGLLAATPLAVVIYLVPDIYVIGRHYRPVGRALERLDRGERPSEEEASAALARALNLPFYSFVRITFVHGPMAALASVVAMTALNLVADAGIERWQVLTFAATALFFASPTHAIFEFFSISRDLKPLIERLAEFTERRLRPEDQKKLVAVRLGSKLLYLSIFVAALPLVFFAASIVFKVDRLLRDLGVAAGSGAMTPLLFWVFGVVLVCVAGSLAMSVLTASEVSRSAAALVAAMRRVEEGKLDARLQITTTDEYADLFRGFNLMIEGLRDEVRMLEVTHALSGELQIDALIRRIMSAATELLGAERSTLFVYDEKTGELWSSFAEGLTIKEIRIPSHSGIAGAVFASGRPENLVDAYADPRFNRGVDQITGYRTRTLLCMPIVGKSGARIGVAEVLNKREGAFTAKDESRLRAFAAQIAVSIENAQLFDEVLRIKNYNESILKSTSNGMVTIDTEGRIATVNEAAAAILKMPAEALVGRRAADVFAAANGWVADAVGRVAATGQRDISVDATLKCAGGDVSVNLTALPLIGLAGEPIGSMLVIENITAEKRVKATMARFMSKEVADQLLAGGEAELGGKDQVVTVLFSDVRQFTTIAEALGARETVSLLNDYFAEMVEVVFQHHGILDKYIGDAIMALFGAPFRRPEDPDNAIMVANEMIVRLASLNRRRGESGRPPLEIGIGLATGDVIVGNVGSPRRMEYTAIGDSVNLASRLEGANKVYGTRILASESTVRALKRRTPLREIDLIKVKGKDRPVAVYEVLGYDDTAGLARLEETLAAWGEGLGAYRAMEWERASAAFEAVRRVRPGDAPSALYLERCRHHRADPPPPTWNGVSVLTEK